ncbi:MAG: hypothetical protein ABH881_03490 [bacterium]
MIIFLLNLPKIKEKILSMSLMAEIVKNYKMQFNSLILAKKVLSVAIVVFILDFIVLFPCHPALAEDGQMAENSFGLIFLGNNGFANSLPINQDRKIKRIDSAVLTAYNSDVWQCDDSPCITANGFNVCEHNIEDTIAANYLPFGTKLRIPELFGDRVFIVRDRMNKRYGDYRMDVWMKKGSDAKNFGVKRAKVEILE